MKTLFLAAVTCLTFSSAFAAKDVFTQTKSGATADYPCVYSFGGLCNADNMEAELQAKCYTQGFVSCTTLVKKDIRTDNGYDMFCGGKASNKCIVTIKGSNEPRTSDY